MAKIPPTLIATKVLQHLIDQVDSPGRGLKGKAGPSPSCGHGACSKLTDGQSGLQAVLVIPPAICVHLHTLLFAPTPGLPWVPVGVIHRGSIQVVEVSSSGILSQAQVSISIVLLHDVCNGLILL